MVGGVALEGLFCAIFSTNIVFSELNDSCVLKDFLCKRYLIFFATTGN